MPSAKSITNAINYLMAFLAASLAGLQGFDWLTFVDAQTALKIVGGLNFLGLLVKAWMTTAEQMAKQIKVES